MLTVRGTELKPVSPKLKAHYAHVRAGAVDRFWDKVDRSGGPDACWPWIGARYAKGYGHVCFKGRHTTATHVACMLVGKELPAGLYWLHDCDNPPCCNPAHLFAGTKKDNSEDCKKKGRTATGHKNGMNTHPEARMPGDKNPMAKLTWEQVRRIREMHSAGDIYQKDIAQAFGVDKMTVSLIVRNKIWKEHLMPLDRRCDAHVFTS